MQREARRTAVLWVTLEFLITLLQQNGVPRSLIVERALPDDTVVLELFADNTHMRIGLLIESASFALVQPGEMPPVLQSPIMRVAHEVA